MTLALHALVERLPEEYQPIFGHPELSLGSARKSLDRLNHIEPLFLALQKHLQRPVRVLDLGCAQGYFSFGLATLGAVVHGIDFVDANIDVCHAIASANPNLNVHFRRSRLEVELDAMSADQYDLVLGLNILHHVAHEEGWEATQRRLGRIADRIQLGIFEVALKLEPMYWSGSQPDDPGDFFRGFSFVHQETTFTTHLSDVRRPLFVVSRHLWCLNQQIGCFETFTDESHYLADNTHQGTRRYFFGDRLLIKLVRLDNPTRGALNANETHNEVSFLKHVPADFRACEMLLHGKNAREAWIVRERIPGRLLLDVIRLGEPVDIKSVLLALLRQLVCLENEGLYHNDIRTWNVLVSDEKEILLIDYGAISAERRDVVWPNDIFLAFTIFVFELSEGLAQPPTPTRAPAISPTRLRSPYREWILRFWATPTEEWSFGLLRDLLLNTEDEMIADLKIDGTVWERWIRAVESGLDSQLSAFRALDSKMSAYVSVSEREGSLLRYELSETRAEASATRRALVVAQEQVNLLEMAARADYSEKEALRRAVAALEAERAALTAERDNLRAALDDRHAELARMQEWHEAELARLLKERDAARAALDATLADLATAVEISGAEAPPPTAGVMELVPVRKRLARKAAKAAYRLVRPVVRPALWRLRGFMTAELNQQLGLLDQRVARLVAVPLQQTPIPDNSERTAGAADEMRRLAVEMERALLTLALERNP